MPGAADTNAPDVQKLSASETVKSPMFILPPVADATGGFFIDAMVFAPNNIDRSQAKQLALQQTNIEVNP